MKSIEDIFVLLPINKNTIMELHEAILKRSSVRQYKDEEVPVEHLKELVRMALHAPSVNNYQPWRFIAIRNKALLQQMALEVTQQIDSLPAISSIASDNIKSQVEWFSTFFENAPAVIAVLAQDYETILEKGVKMDHEEVNRMRNYPDIQSIGACIENMLLTAVDLGYGACWLSAPMIAKASLEVLLDIAAPFRLMAFVAVGKALHDVPPKPKKDIGDAFVLID
ncbi:MAG: nitroreductase family protein [Bacteroidota bacterium]